jgi:hypothetical protein
MDLIKGKVADLKGDYAVIINRGTENGVEEGMRFIIYTEGEEIRDPDTDDSLGKIDYIKAKVKVKYSAEKYSWAETYETIQNPAISSLMGSFSQGVRATLSKSQSPSSPIQIELPVMKGDLVKQIID